jgi:hypothetical protein
MGAADAALAAEITALSLRLLSVEQHLKGRDNADHLLRERLERVESVLGVAHPHASATSAVPGDWEADAIIHQVPTEDQDDGAHRKTSIFRCVRPAVLRLEEGRDSRRVGRLEAGDLVEAVHRCSPHHLRGIG